MGVPHVQLGLIFAPEYEQVRYDSAIVHDSMQYMGHNDESRIKITFLNSFGSVDWTMTSI
jgi:hypothetical protein